MKHISFNESSVLQEYSKIMSDKGIVKEASAEEIEKSELEKIEAEINVRIAKFAQNKNQLGENLIEKMGIGKLLDQAIEKYTEAESDEDWGWTNDSLLRVYKDAMDTLGAIKDRGIFAMTIEKDLQEMQDVFDDTKNAIVSVLNEVDWGAYGVAALVGIAAAATIIATGGAALGPWIASATAASSATAVGVGVGAGAAGLSGGIMKMLSTKFDVAAMDYAGEGQSILKKILYRVNLFIAQNKQQPGQQLGQQQQVDTTYGTSIYAKQFALSYKNFTEFYNQHMYNLSKIGRIGDNSIIGVEIERAKNLVELAATNRTDAGMMEAVKFLVDNTKRFNKHKTDIEAIVKIKTSAIYGQNGIKKTASALTQKELDQLKKEVNLPSTPSSPAVQDNSPELFPMMLNDLFKRFDSAWVAYDRKADDIVTETGESKKDQADPGPLIAEIKAYVEKQRQKLKEITDQGKSVSSDSARGVIKTLERGIELLKARIPVMDEFIRTYQKRKYKSPPSGVGSGGLEAAVNDGKYSTAALSKRAWDARDMEKKKKNRGRSKDTLAGNQKELWARIQIALKKEGLYSGPTDGTDRYNGQAWRLISEYLGMEPADAAYKKYVLGKLGLAQLVKDLGAKITVPDKSYLSEEAGSFDVPRMYGDRSGTAIINYEHIINRNYVEIVERLAKSKADLRDMWNDELLIYLKAIMEYAGVMSDMADERVRNQIITRSTYDKLTQGLSDLKEFTQRNIEKQKKSLGIDWEIMGRAANV